MSKSHPKASWSGRPVHQNEGFEPPLLFYHPFAYAAHRSLGFGCATHESIVPERSAA